MPQEAWGWIIKVHQSGIREGDGKEVQKWRQRDLLEHQGSSTSWSQCTGLDIGSEGWSQYTCLNIRSRITVLMLGDVRLTSDYENGHEAPRHILGRDGMWSLAIVIQQTATIKQDLASSSRHICSHNVTGSWAKPIWAQMPFSDLPIL